MNVLFSLFGVAEISEHRTEEFVCDLYSKPKLKKLCDARYALFRQRYATTKDNDLLSKIKGPDASTLHPSKPVLLQKLKHTFHVTKLWRNAHLQDPLAGDDPIQFGWKLQDGNFKILLYEGDQMPRDISEFQVVILGTATGGNCV